MVLSSCIGACSRALCFPSGSAGKESACNVGDLVSIPGLGISPEEGKGYPLQYSPLENFMDCIVHGVAKNQTQLSDFHCLCFMNSRLLCIAKTNMFYTVELKNKKPKQCRQMGWYASICIKKGRKTFACDT